jgi:hypothetical protein
LILEVHGKASRFRGVSKRSRYRWRVLTFKIKQGELMGELEEEKKSCLKNGIKK